MKTTISVRLGMLWLGVDEELLMQELFPSKMQPLQNVILQVANRAIHLCRSGLIALQRFQCQDQLLPFLSGCLLQTRVDGLAG